MIFHISFIYKNLKKKSKLPRFKSYSVTNNIILTETNKMFQLNKIKYLDT